MKLLLALLLLLHALIHLTGFFQPSRLRLSNHVILWLLVCLLFIASCVMVVIGKQNWWIVTMPAIIISQVLILTNWQVAKWGTLMNIFLAMASIVAFGKWHFDRQFRRDATALLATRSFKQKNIITREMVEALPSPVSKWLSSSGVIGTEIIHTVRLQQGGSMRLKENTGQWNQMHAEQYFNLDEPSFIWKVQMNMMRLLPVSGHDALINGHGSMNIKLFSLLNIVNDADEKIDQASLQRWLAEISWFPQAALMPWINWEAIDGHAARARLTWKGVEAVVDFYFDEHDRLITCVADRYKGGGKKALLEKWEIHCSHHHSINGIIVPTSAEVSWILRSGRFNWCNLQITSLEYNPTSVYSD